MASLQNKVKNALDEARILVLGTQVLLGFQFRAFFEAGWDELPPADRWSELGGLAALLIAMGALFLPAARHRLVEQGNDSERFHRFTLQVLRFALAPVGLALHRPDAPIRTASPVRATARRIVIENRVRATVRLPSEHPVRRDCTQQAVTVLTGGPLFT